MPTKVNYYFDAIATKKQLLNTKNVMARSTVKKE
ncbi:hypothetical protein BDFB_010620 [Asbolus verrucosus]|uniref:Uncharacterized protein n=1 Tax=Asbolus verrucosus TaxID=1661398 RepID=A0A482VC17_ASBVE|nr:hypothetical protein BDFB_010620 [Asbolus verrucosus]